MKAAHRLSPSYLLVIVLVLGLYVIVPQLGDFRSSWHLLSHPKLDWVLSALLFTASTYFSAAVTYGWLAWRPLAYGRTLLVQLAAMFINRLLPSGVGALGANYTYLRHEGHTPAQATAIVAVNNVLGFVGHSLLIAGLIILGQTSLQAISGHYRHGLKMFMGYFLISLTIAVILALVFGRRRLHLARQDLKQQLASYRRRPGHLLLALASSVTLTLGNVGSLYACVYAVGGHLPFTAVLLIFTVGISAATATPTPGGLGGFEAGLVAGLIAYSVPSAAALAVALLYRLLSYWLPLLSGGLAFVLASRRHLFST